MKILTGTFILLYAVSLGYGMSFKSEGRIVGGSEIELNQAPYQVSVQENFSHTCGGNYIYDSWSQVVYTIISFYCKKVQ